MLSLPDTAILGVLALIVFGPERMPAVARTVGKVMAEMKATSNAFVREMERSATLTPPGPAMRVEPQAATAGSPSAGENASDVRYEQLPLTVHESPTSLVANGAPAPATSPVSDATLQPQTSSIAEATAASPQGIDGESGDPNTSDARAHDSSSQTAEVNDSLTVRVSPPAPPTPYINLASSEVATDDHTHSQSS